MPVIVSLWWVICTDNLDVQLFTEGIDIFHCTLLHWFWIVVSDTGNRKGTLFSGFRNRTWIRFCYRNNADLSAWTSSTLALWVRANTAVWEKTGGLRLVFLALILHHCKWLCMGNHDPAFCGSQADLRRWAFHPSLNFCWRRQQQSSVWIAQE